MFAYEKIAPPLVNTSVEWENGLPFPVKLHPIMLLFSLISLETKRKQIAPPLPALLSSNEVFMISLFDLNIINAPPQSVTQFLVKLELIILLPVP